MLDATTKKLLEYFIGYLNFVLHVLISMIAGGSAEGLVDKIVLAGYPVRRRGQDRKTQSSHF
jgi:hypothetical protein